VTWKECYNIFLRSNSNWLPANIYSWQPYVEDAGKQESIKLRVWLTESDSYIFEFDKIVFDYNKLEKYRFKGGK